MVRRHGDKDGQEHRHYGWTLGAGKSGKVTRLKAPGSRPRTRLFRSRDASTPATSDAGGFWTDMASQLNSSARGSKGPISPGSAALRHDGDAMANVVARGLNKNKSRLLRPRTLANCPRPNRTREDDGRTSDTLTADTTTKRRQMHNMRRNAYPNSGLAPSQAPPKALWRSRGATCT
ncbi:hypothetical protein X797_004281 [Metarhizium robertsii]|uniref:Uncharacterized protein n=1 Tax=Metarhizium robertsii TaxID=568076 RepID=A0A0A1UZ09_9HYPO|nr:hypothetical protein X797_004281 [Metarhizium robertsii]